LTTLTTAALFGKLREHELEMIRLKVQFTSLLELGLNLILQKRDQEHQDLYRFTFLKGYVQSFANKQVIPLKRSPRSVQYNTITLAPRKSTLHPTTHSLLHPTAAIKQCRTLLHNPNYKPYVIWVTNAQLQITNLV